MAGAPQRSTRARPASGLLTREPLPPVTRARRHSPGPFSHDIPRTGLEMGSEGPAASLKGPFSVPKPLTEPNAQTYRPMTLFWDGHKPLGKSLTAPRSLLVMTSKPNLKPTARMA